MTPVPLAVRWATLLEMLAAGNPPTPAEMQALEARRPTAYKGLAAAFAAHLVGKVGKVSPVTACRGSWRWYGTADTCRAEVEVTAQAAQLCLAHHAEPQTVTVLSVDAWSDGMGGWSWNNWRCVGEIPHAWLRLAPRRLLRLLRSEGYLGPGSVGRARVEDDGYNVCIQERSGRTVIALAYGARQ